MIYMGGFLKGKALVFGIMGIVFIVLAFTMSSFTRTTFLIIGISWLAAAGFSLAMHKMSQGDQSQSQQGPGNWVS